MTCFILFQFKVHSNFPFDLFSDPLITQKYTIQVSNVGFSTYVVDF